MDFRRYVREQLPSLVTPREPEIVEELALHLEDLYREQRSAGLDHDEALARAIRALTASAQTAGDIQTASRAPAERLLDRVHAALDEPVAARPARFAFISDLRRDIRHGVRSLLHAPGFTAVVVVTLALGTGATAVIFSAIDAVLLRDAPVADPERVVSVYMQYAPRATTNPARGPQVGGASYLDYTDLRASGVLADLATFGDTEISLDVESGAERVEAQIVSGNYFDVLGVRPAIGRTFMPPDDVGGSPVRVVVISYRLWQERFGADADLVGRSITVNGNSYDLIGVAPRGFRGALLGDASDAWLPIALQEEVRPPSAGPLRRRLGGLSMLGVRDVRWLSMVGRLREGQSVTEAAAALDVVGQRLATAYPDANRDLSATAVALGTGPGVRARTWPVLVLLATAVALVLMIACANVAGLMLTRASGRRREMAVRMAMGAGRGQLLRQWLTEAVLLGLAGSTAGLLLAVWTPSILRGLGIPESVDLSVNLNVLTFTLVVGVTSGLVFGIAPVLQFVRKDALSGLRDDGGAVVGGSAVRLRSAFVVVQVALSLVLMVGAGLFVRTLMQAYAVDLGYSVDRMLIVELPPHEGYTQESGLALYDELLARISALPGVTSAGAARVTVLSGNNRTVGVSTDGQPLRDDRSNAIPIRVNVVSRGYLDAMGIRVLAGRQFDETDVQSSPRVAIISRGLGERLWPDSNPIGRVMVWQDGPLQVIAVVPDTVYLRSTEREPRPFFYLPLSQNYENGVSLHIRTAGDPLSLLNAVRQVTRSLDPKLALTRPRRLVDDFQSSVETERLLARLSTMLSGLALLLASVGLYGVMAYTVRQRTREVWLRLALGATPGVIMQLIVGRGARLIAIGVGLGLLGAAASVRLVRAQLFGVEPTDAVTWLAVCALLLVVGLIACGIPARRAMKVAPATVLRTL
jgi:putative ABC transport system permease protein